MPVSARQAVVIGVALIGLLALDRLMVATVLADEPDWSALIFPCVLVLLLAAGMAFGWHQGYGFSLDDLNWPILLAFALGFGGRIMMAEALHEQPAPEAVTTAAGP